ncbi:unnamed protein product [Paramecium sonneborni]|uniref:Uncharacterized protein n=1 Tax=Paramecium sonneborni TaxID=65129 RepID=A0A8S1M0I5_9CILI|nr:unnamed protein product [Paramecium sonneborni]
MKALLLVCLIATSMMVNAVQIPQEKVLSAQSDAPSFLHLQQTCVFCCNGRCCQSAGYCNKGSCTFEVAPWTCVQG